MTTNILYVDDLEASRYLITRQLTEQGFNVIEATSGAEALQKITPDLDCVLLDVNLPDMHGLEVCQRIKEMQHGISLPVIMFSSVFVGDSHKVDGLVGGADAYLTHPTDFSVLAATLHSIMRARTAEKEAAAFAERQRLSRDLHDSVSQLLFASSTLAEGLARSDQYDPVELKEDLMRLSRLNRGALAEMRTLLIELRLNELKEIDLPELLKQLRDGIMGRTQLSIQFESVLEHELSKDLQVMFYRIAQEAFNNIVKHARATQVEMRLISTEQRTLLSIQDDGKGFDPSHINWNSMGLNIMRERAETAGLAIHIKSQIGQGTRVTVTWQPDTPSEFSITDHL